VYPVNVVKYKEGYDVRVIVEGPAVKLSTELAKPDFPLNL